MSILANSILPGWDNELVYQLFSNLMYLRILTGFYTLIKSRKPWHSQPSVHRLKWWYHTSLSVGIYSSYVVSLKRTELFEIRWFLTLFRKSHPQWFVGVVSGFKLKIRISTLHFPWSEKCPSRCYWFQDPKHQVQANDNIDVPQQTYLHSLAGVQRVSLHSCCSFISIIRQREIIKEVQL